MSYSLMLSYVLNQYVKRDRHGLFAGVFTELPDVIDAIGLIEHTPAWTKQDQHGMEIWFIKYLDWLLTSDAGKKQGIASLRDQ
jgi:hypothetical protein